MMSLRSTLLVGTLGAVSVVVPMQAALADVTVIPSGSVSVGGGYSSNPFLQSTGASASGSAQITVAPQVELIDGTDQAVISANYNRTQYTSNYGGNDGYGVNVSATSQRSARTSINVALGYSSQILGAANSFGATTIGIPTGVGTGTTTGTGTGTDTGTGTIATPIVTTPVIGGIGGDIGLIGLRQRRNELFASAGASYRPDERSTWSGGINASRSSYPDSNGFATGFRTYGANIGYTRSLTEKSSVGFTLSGTSINYNTSPTTRYLTPRLTYSRTLALHWTLDVAAGASIVDDGINSTSVTASATATVCRAGERGRLCLSASREPSVSAFGGARNQTSVSASYSYQVSELTSVAASASFQRSSTGNGLRLPTAITSNQQDFITGDLTLNRRIGRRLSAYGTASYRDVNGLGLPVKADIGGRIGLSLAIGGR